MDYENLAPDTSQRRAMLYKPKKIPIIVYEERIQAYLEDGWCESPAEFAQPEDFGVGKRDQIKLDDLEGKIDGIAENINGQLNIDNMERS